MGEDWGRIGREERGEERGDVDPGELESHSEIAMGFPGGGRCTFLPA